MNLYDISEIIDQYSIDDYIIVKMDIEGTEFPLFEHFLRQGTINKIDYVAMEFHDIYRNQTFGDKIKFYKTYLQTVNYQTRVHNPLKRPAQFKKKTRQNSNKNETMRACADYERKSSPFFPPNRNNNNKEAISSKKNPVGENRLYNDLVIIKCC